MTDRLREAVKAVLKSSGSDHWAMVELDEALHEAENKAWFSPVYVQIATWVEGEGWKD